MANTRTRSTNVTVGNQDVALLKSVTTGRGPISDLAVDGDTVVTTNFGDDSVAVLGADTLALRGGIVAGQPTAVAVVGDRAFAAVSSASYDAVVVIDTTSGDVLKEYALSFNVTAIATSVDGKRVYAGRAGEEGVDVAVIDVHAERVGTIFVTKDADATIDALCLDATGRRLYVGVSDSRSSRLLTVDVETARVRRALEIGAPIRGLALGMDSTAYVLTSDIAHGGVLYVVDLVANHITADVSVAATPTQMVLSQDGARAYVVDYDHVAVVDVEHRTVVGEVSVGARPSAIALSDERLFVADYDGGVTTYTVAATAPMLYAPFVDALPAPRELEPAV
ncbi:hypothetical protein H7K45_19345 [Mycobacterium yunnanensis]|uniref:40-residue YVTN family beta-propeller repeat-containing protein n=1 Tax=Mycobacterium yunnanensis TaxID=368477 RepID=A0A9X3C3U3_9MYCO|nr:hypothetical protein [Mycobacterium yunnanensis]MCV7422707.1 hypothetical protein [Mycobacterium yunnanensis]